MRLALCARNMIAPLRTLNRHLAPWTRLDIVVLHPLLEQPTAARRIRTLEPIMRLYMAIGANSQQTRWALQDRVVPP